LKYFVSNHTHNLLQREEESGCAFVIPPPICSFWNVANSAWDTRGCHYAEEIEDGNQSVTCICNHLTSFGIIFDWQGAADPQEPGKQITSQAFSNINKKITFFLYTSSHLILYLLILYFTVIQYVWSQHWVLTHLFLSSCFQPT
jgi:GPCR proteolysis site, GPS, motif